jgi:iron complex transport system permease protein
VIKIEYCKRQAVWLLLAVLLIMIILAVAIGSIYISPLKVMKILLYQLPGVGGKIVPNWPESYETIITLFRLPRVVLAMVVGSALALAGAIFQGLFKNPMADPHIIGASAGAGLGATLAISLGLSIGWNGLGAVPLLAALGSFLTVILVYNLARTGGTVPIPNLLLAGVALSSFLSAMISLLIYFGQDQMHTIVFWLMGGLSGRTWDYVWFTLPYLLVAACVAIYYARDLNLMLLGEESAHNLGVEVERVKAILLLVASILTGAAVAASGMIGFVGLIVPHVARILVGPDHRILVPVSILAGAILLLGADILARTVLAPVELPLGVVTALFGAPFFIFLLRRYRGPLF